MATIGEVYGRVEKINEEATALFNNWEGDADLIDISLKASGLGDQAYALSRITAAFAQAVGEESSPMVAKG